MWGVLVSFGLARWFGGVRERRMGRAVIAMKAGFRCAVFGLLMVGFSEVLHADYTMPPEYTAWSFADYQTSVSLGPSTKYLDNFVFDKTTIGAWACQHDIQPNMAGTVISENGSPQYWCGSSIERWYAGFLCTNPNWQTIPGFTPYPSWTAIQTLQLCPGSNGDWYSMSLCQMCTVGTAATNLDRNRGCGVTQDSRSSCSTKHPINTGVANKFRVEADFVLPGSFPLRFERYYNSRGRRSNLVGFHWLHTYDRQISFHALAGQPISNAKALRPDGNASYFNLVNGVWTPVTADITESLTVSQDTSGTITGAVYTLNDGTVETYGTPVNNNGIVLAPLRSIRDRSGLTQTLTYDTSGRLATVTDDAFGHALTFTYDANGRLATLTDPNGKVTGFAYDTHQNLIQVSYPDGTAKRYHYENTGFPTNLTGISYVDTGGAATRYATFGYDTNGMANASQLAGGQEAVTVTYSPSSTSVISSATITDAASNKEVLTFGVTLGVVNLTGKQLYDANGVPIGNPLTQLFDTNNNLVCKKDAENHVTLYSYNSTNQKVSETQGLVGTDCNTCLLNPDSCNSGGTKRVTNYQYLSPILDLPTRITSPSVYGSGYKTVTISYGDTRFPLLPTTITQSGYTPSGSAVARSVTLGYNSFGAVASIDGLRTDVNDITTLTYYTCTTGGGCGQLQSVTNALGQTTTYDYYDGAGRVTQTTDPNGLKTVYGYDERGRVKTLTETPSGGTARVTTFTYHPAGMVDSVTDPDGVKTTYQYDAALQLRHVFQAADNQGHFNDHAYAYDTRGNPNAESLYDASGTLVRTEGRVFDARNHLYQVTRGGFVNTTVTTVHDALGVLRKLTDGNGNATNYTPDALNRLYQGIDTLSSAAGKAVTYGYDVNDRVTSVKAANDLTTTYTVDDLGNVLSEVSPDRGTITYTYDAAGNVRTRAQASFTTTWTYDALNRVLSQQSSDSSTGRYDYAYDSCRKGSLCSIQKNGAFHLLFFYDTFGRRNYEASSANLYSLTGYTAAGRLSSLTYNDGRVVNYLYDTAGQVNQVTTTLNGVTKTLASNILYYPFGPVKSLSYGDGTGLNVFLDTAYRPNLRFDGPFFESLTQYDGADNILTRYAPSIQSYGYDAVNRLTAAADTASFGTLAWTYDLNGNRQTDTRNGTNTTYAYVPTGSNWLYQFGSNYRTQGMAGTLAYGTGIGILAYDGYRRLVNANNAASYTYDAFNRRLSKTVGSTTTRFQYGLNGELLAETSGSSTTLDYVYLNGVPLARIDNGSNIYYYHTDHLGTPQSMTNSTGTVVWAAKVEPFGNATVTTQTITNNLRFAGQYFDQETGMHYNWNRYYDPKTGRYITSDPIGLTGGLNTYLYGSANPLLFIDPFGLCDKRCLTTVEVANILFNETQSLSGPDIQTARNNIAHAIMNGDTKKGDNRPKTAPTSAKVPDISVLVYQQCLDAAMKAENDSVDDVDPTKGAFHFNFRNSNSRAPFFGIPIQTQTGPLSNSYPTPTLNASGIYANTYK